MSRMSQVYTLNVKLQLLLQMSTTIFPFLSKESMKSLLTKMVKYYFIYLFTYLFYKHNLELKL